MTPFEERLETTLTLAVRLGQLVERSNQSGDVDVQAHLQESIEWIREQLRAARRDLKETAAT